MSGLYELRTFFEENQKTIKKGFIFNLIRNATALLLFTLIMFIPCIRIDPVDTFLDSSNISRDISSDTKKEIVEMMDERWKEYKKELKETQEEFDISKEQALILFPPFSSIDNAFWNKIEKRLERELSSEERDKFNRIYIKSTKRVSVYNMAISLKGFRAKANFAGFLIIAILIGCAGLLGLSAYKFFTDKNFQYTYLQKYNYKYGLEKMTFNTFMLNAGVYSGYCYVFPVTIKLIECFMEILFSPSIIIVPAIFISLALISSAVLRRYNPLHIKFMEEANKDIDEIINNENSMYVNEENVENTENK